MDNKPQQPGQASESNMPVSSQSNTSPNGDNLPLASSPTMPSTASTASPSMTSDPLNSSSPNQPNLSTPLSSTASIPAANGIPSDNTVHPNPDAALPSHHGPNPLIIASMILLVVAVIGGVFFFAMMQNQQPVEQPSVAVPTTALSPTLAATPTIDAAVSSQSGTTDTQLEQDAKTIEQNITGVQNEEATIDQGLNDQPANLNQ